MSHPQPQQQQAPALISQDEILSGTRSIVQSLEVLKNEHSSMIDSLVSKLAALNATTGHVTSSAAASGVDQPTATSSSSGRSIIEEEIAILRNSDDMVHLGISEATVLIQLSTYVQSIEAEKQKIKSQVKRLCQENAWLRDELAASQKKLQESEQRSAQIEVELSHLTFLKELKKFDDESTSTSQQQPQQQHNSHQHVSSGDQDAALRHQQQQQQQQQGDDEDTNCKYNVLEYSTNLLRQSEL